MQPRAAGAHPTAVQDASQKSHPVVIIGAGVGGLALAARLASRGVPVRVFEKEATVGGKMRVVQAGEGPGIDAGPTVLTMRWVFDELFREVGERLDDHVTLGCPEVLARHGWPDGARLDLYVDPERSAGAIGAAFGAREADGYRRFVAHGAAILEAVREPFLRSPLPRLADMLSLAGLRQARALAQIDATRTLWSSLGDFFRDPHLLALFGRYATYVGSSPFEAPATLNVIAAVEQAGAWVVKGGMGALGRALLGLATRQGAAVETGAAVDSIVTERGRAVGVRLASGETVRASAVVSNGDVAHLGELLGPSAGRRAPRVAHRSLSALVWTGHYVAEGFALDHHNVFFSSDYPAEFEALFGRQSVPADPTIYVCAQDRGPFEPPPAPGQAERLLVLVNAPATGDDPAAHSPGEITTWQATIPALLRRHGLHLTPRATRVTTPRDFDRLFPATGGALYGPASHGLTAAFARPGCRTAVPGLYVVGGSAHPGAGVPMVALSARIAEATLRADLPAISSCRPAATPGGTSTASASAGAMA